jgi:CTP:molybdopterin cytidylyltransferase MocA
MFGQLANLPPTAGARHLLRNPEGKQISFPLPEAGIDLDTPEDFAALIASAEGGLPEAGFHSRK